MALEGEALRIALRVAQASIRGPASGLSETSPPASIVNAVRNSVQRRGEPRPSREDARAATRLAIRSAQAAERAEGNPTVVPGAREYARDSGLGAGPGGRQYLTRVVLVGTDQTGADRHIIVPVFSSEPISPEEARLRAMGQIPDDERAQAERYRSDRRLRLEGVDGWVIGLFRSA